MKDLELFEQLWYSRNRCHEYDQMGADRFWATAELVAREYVALLESKNTTPNSDYTKLPIVKDIKLRNCIKEIQVAIEKLDNFA